VSLTHGFRNGGFRRSGGMFGFLDGSVDTLVRLLNGSLRCVHSVVHTVADRGGTLSGGSCDLDGFVANLVDLRFVLAQDARGAFENRLCAVSQFRAFVRTDFRNSVKRDEDSGLNQ
jgi:hypothetical protein